MSEEFTFGEHVTITHRLVRRVKYPGSYIRLKVWEPEGSTVRHRGMFQPPEVVAEPIPAIVIGIRTLADGETSWGSEDEPIAFIPQKRFKAYLVATDLRSAPFYVLPEHIHRTE